MRNHQLHCKLGATSSNKSGDRIQAIDRPENLTERIRKMHRAFYYSVYNIKHRIITSFALARLIAGSIDSKVEALLNLESKAAVNFDNNDF